MFVWERDIGKAATEKKNDLQSGLSSWCTKCFSFQVVSTATTSGHLGRCSFCLSDAYQRRAIPLVTDGKNTWIVEIIYAYLNEALLSRCRPRSRSRIHFTTLKHKARLSVGRQRPDTKVPGSRMHSEEGIRPDRLILVNIS